MKSKIKLILLLLTCVSQLSYSQIVLVKGSKPKAQIVVDENDSIDMKAALLLQTFSKKITGAELNIVSPEKKKKGDVLIGKFQLPVSGLNTSDIKEDGFYLSSNDAYLRIVGTLGKGSVYGVVTLLEDYFGVHYYAADTYSLDKSTDMIVPGTLLNWIIHLFVTDRPSLIALKILFISFGIDWKNQIAYLQVTCGYIRSMLSCLLPYMERNIRNIML